VPVRPARAELPLLENIGLMERRRAFALLRASGTSHDSVRFE
jgi:hypothetical protein